MRCISIRSLALVPALAAGLFALGAPSSPAGPLATPLPPFIGGDAATVDVAIVGSPSPTGLGGCQFTVVRDALLATGKFNKVGLIDAAGDTPALADIIGFDSILVFTNVSLFDNNAFGDILADYVDMGGGVVGPCVPSNSLQGGGLDIGGRWATGGYEVFAFHGNLAVSPANLGAILEPAHPAMAGVSALDGGPNAPRPMPGTPLAPGARVIAEWTDGAPLVVQGANPRRIDLGIFPPDASCEGFNWISGDAYLIMANALEWTANAPAPPTVFCTAKANSLGCTPAIAFQGTPRAGEASGFVVSASNVRNQRPGVLLYSLEGRAALPFQGGTLCMSGTARRTPARNSGGHAIQVPDCSGGYRIDMNAYASDAFGGKPHPALSLPGQQVVVQWWSRDPGDAFGSGLTDAVIYVIG